MSEPVHNQAKRSQFGRLFGYSLPHVPFLALAAILLFAASGLGLGLPYVVGRLVSSLTGVETKWAFEQLAMVMLGLLIGQSLLTLLGGLLVAWVDERILAQIRTDAFQKLIRLPMQFFTHHRHGEIVSRVNYDVEMIGAITTQNLIHACQALLTVCGALALILITAKSLFVLVVLALPIFLVLFLIFGLKGYAIAEEAQERVADMAASVSAAVQHITALKSFAHEDAEDESFRALAAKAFKVGMKSSLLAAVYQPATGIVAFGATVAVLWTGRGMVQARILGPGDLIAVLLYVGVMVGAMSVLVSSGMRVLQAMGALRRVFSIMGFPAELEGELTTELSGRVELKSVSFSYESELVLDRVCLTIEPGETVALIGTSGAGKTTLLNLLCSFYVPDSGSVEFDDVNLRDLQLEALRKQIALVPQVPSLLDASVLENIRYGRPDANDDDVIQAAKMARAHYFITGLEHGYKTEVGEGGCRLSVGQRQRICLARAILKNATIYLLDEPTSALDKESEHTVIEAIGELAEHKTCIIVAHQEALLEIADRTIRIEGGRVLE